MTNEAGAYAARFSVLPGYPAGTWLVDRISIVHADGAPLRYEVDPEAGVYVRVDEQFQRTPTALAPASFVKTE